MKFKVENINIQFLSKLISEMAKFWFQSRTSAIKRYPWHQMKLWKLRRQVWTDFRLKSTVCSCYLILHFLQFNCSNISFPNIGYPQPGYSNDLDCRWFVEVNDPSAILEIVINRIRMEQNCKYDRLEIYEGGYIENLQTRPNAQFLINILSIKLPWTQEVSYCRTILLRYCVGSWIEGITR